ncbi:transcriptional regulator [Protofrankia symbiont of Coriaria ruscifolia]|uniref:Putative transcriptional regulator n=1 Tax=Candidatus Protofrankia californiensis TaxID=1839754 RepID=A0A1C3PE97_9ACTN|nr:transcriptional regulator [Protofrankia symbiont of Coriaria ruscifolia]SBW28152.1 putative transcriptional regulator [Candidatus Protofrankia californiensis]
MNRKPELIGFTQDEHPIPDKNGSYPTLFARLLAETSVSDTRFARQINERARRHRRIELGLARTTVGHWRRGMRPRDPMVAELAAAEMSTLVGYRITPTDLGWRGETFHGDDFGLLVAEKPAGTLGTIAGLSGRDMRRRDLLQDGSAFIATAFADSVLASLTGVVNTIKNDDALASTPTATMIRDMTETFRKLDARYGSGEIRGQVVTFLHDRTKTALDARHTPDLFGALAELTQFSGWLAQDSDRQSLAQRYYIQALGLAEHAGDAMLASRILSAMSDQAGRLGQLRQSLALAKAALDRSRSTASRSVRVMLHDKHAWALARNGDEAGCGKALSAMDAELERACADDGPPWSAHYNDADVAECKGHCFMLLGKAREAEPLLLESRARQLPSRTRTRSYAEADLALSYLRRPGPDVEAALDAGRRAVELASHLDSVRITEKLRELDRGISRYDDVVAVREWRRHAAPLIARPGIPTKVAATVA